MVGPEAARVGPEAARVGVGPDLESAILHLVIMRRHLSVLRHIIMFGTG